MSNWPDCEGSMRDYLRADASLAALVGNRVFFGIPDRVAFPLVTVTRVSGGDDPSTIPIDRPLLQLDCWGRKGNKTEAFNVAAAVRDALFAISNTTSGTALLYGASVIGGVFFPDPETDQPRYVLTVELAARTVPA
jgi:Protein of unknown function (DUF3168)